MTERPIHIRGLDSYVERVVAEAPPLSPAQRDRIATLINGDHKVEHLLVGYSQGDDFEALEGLMDDE